MKNHQIRVARMMCPLALSFPGLRTCLSLPGAPQARETRKGTFGSQGAKHIQNLSCVNFRGGFSRVGIGWVKHFWDHVVMIYYGMKHIWMFMVDNGSPRQSFGLRVAPTLYYVTVSQPQAVNDGGFAMELYVLHRSQPGTAAMS